jgi:hypothetical protein
MTPPDLPVLDVTVRLMETNPFPSVRDIAAAAGMDIETTGRALQDLGGTFLELSKSYGGPESWNVSGVTKRARREVGQWISPRRSGGDWRPLTDPVGRSWGDKSRAAQGLWEEPQ